ncbi:hypothetical protein Tco_0936872 [Tanacetum coccineum]|uniref:Uncharacterized protein n=1 Tax=Tanacetum coccineum TaxID=301880 RepID=A0ABQ5DFA6_9ASTR
MPILSVEDLYCCISVSKDTTEILEFKTSRDRYEDNEVSDPIGGLVFKGLRKSDGKRIIVILDKDMSHHTTGYKIDNLDIQNWYYETTSWILESCKRHRSNLVVLLLCSCVLGFCSSGTGSLSSGRGMIHNELSNYANIDLSKGESGGDIVDLTGDEDPTDEDGDIGMGDSTGVLMSLGGEISSGGNKSRESYIGDSDNTGDGDTTVGGAIEA